MNSRGIAPFLHVADQPTADDLTTLASQGYTAVVNLRHEGEPEQPIGVEAEGERVRQAGLAYLSYPVGGSPLTPEGVRAVLELIEQHAQAGGCTLLHCRKGGRAVALALLREALAQHWSAAEVAARGAEAGLPVDGNLRVLVEQYMVAHPDIL